MADQARQDKAAELLLRHLIVWRNHARQGKPTPMDLNRETRDFLGLRGTTPEEALAVLREEVSDA